MVTFITVVKIRTTNILMILKILIQMRMMKRMMISIDPEKWLIKRRL
jgi:hypothetical protein